MEINDSRSPWKDYWATRPAGTRIAAMAIIAGLIAMYSVMGTLAIFGVWRNNLLSLNSNWPWAFPLAGLSLLGRRFNRTILFHCMAFLPLVLMQCVMEAWYCSSGVMKFSLQDFWYMPANLIAIAVVNVVAFKWLTKGE